jgi:branched-chain amino acid transport system substrate-binding protein
VSAPLTGPVAIIGGWFLEGMKLAEAEINEAGGVDGRPISLVIEDDKCNAKEGTNAVTKLITADDTKVMVLYCGAVSAAAAPVIDGRALVFSGSVRTEPLEGKYPFLFNMAPSPIKEAQVLGEHLSQRGIKKIAIFRQADFFGETMENKLRQVLKEKGIEVVVQNATENLSTPDFRTDLAKVKPSGAEAIFTSFNAAQYIVLLKQADELGVKLPFFSVWTTESPLLISSAGKLAEGVIYTYAFSEGSSKAYEDFKQAFNAKYGHNPDVNATNGYDATHLIVRAIKACEADVSCMIEKTNQISNYEGTSGTFSFKENQADKQVFLKTIKNGEFIK